LFFDTKTEKIYFSLSSITNVFNDVYIACREHYVPHRITSKTVRDNNFYRAF